MKKNTRDDIIDAAKNLFQMQGYHATGINQIIKNSGAPKGSLYYYFPEGKEEIAIAAIESIRDSVLKEISQIVSEADEPVEAIKAQLRHVASRLLDTEKMEFRIGLIAFECANSNERIRMACEKTYTEWMSVNENFLIQKGYPKESAKKIAVVVNILIEGAVTMSITYEDMSYFTLLIKNIEGILTKM